LFTRRLKNFILSSLSARLQRWAGALAGRLDVGDDLYSPEQENGSEPSNEDPGSWATGEQEPWPGAVGPPKEWLDRVRAAAPHLLHSAYRRDIPRAQNQRPAVHPGAAMPSPLRGGHERPPLESSATSARMPEKETGKSEASRPRLRSPNPISGPGLPETRRSFTLKDVRQGPPPPIPVPSTEPSTKAPERTKAALPVTPVRKATESTTPRYATELAAVSRSERTVRRTSRPEPSELKAQASVAKPLAERPTTRPGERLTVGNEIRSETQPKPDRLPHDSTTAVQAEHLPSHHECPQQSAGGGQPGSIFRTSDARIADASFASRSEARPPAFRTWATDRNSDRRPTSFPEPPLHVWPELSEANDPELLEEWRHELHQLQRLQRLEREQRGEAWNE
jgi:hypothetical protein